MQRSWTHPCLHTDAGIRYTPVVCKCTPAAPRLRELGRPPKPGRTSPPAPRLPKFTGFLSPLPPPHANEAGGGAGLQEAVAAQR